MFIQAISPGNVDTEMADRLYSTAPPNWREKYGKNDYKVKQPAFLLNT